MAEGWPHPPPAPEERRLWPQPAFLVRGAGLLLLVISAIAGAWGLVRLSPWLAPLSGVLGGVTLLAAWGAAVQFVGGEKVDDHPWV